MTKKHKLMMESHKINRWYKLLIAVVVITGVLLPHLSVAGDMVFLDLASGLTGATTQMTSIWSLVNKLILAIGGLVGLIGGVRIYIKWNHGEREITKDIVGWAGACVFLLLVGTLLTAFGI